MQAGVQKAQDTLIGMLKANQSVWSTRALWGLTVCWNDEFSYSKEYIT